jgi:hypothetical protein
MREMPRAYHVPMRQAFDGALSPTPHYYRIMGRAAEIARSLGSRIGGAEHLFLGMLHDGGRRAGDFPGCGTFSDSRPGAHQLRPATVVTTPPELLLS